MKWINARRRHPLAGYVVVLIALAFFGAGYAFLAPDPGTAEAQTLAAESTSDDREQPDVARGKEIYNKSCASCHGTDFSGTDDAPALTDVGGAAIDFQVSTGRMPSTDPDTQMPRKAPVFSQEEINDLIAYYKQEGGSGPEVPQGVPGSAPQRADFSDEEEYEAAKEEYDEAKESYVSGAEDTESGMKLYLTNCAHCHSWSGGGGALTGGNYAPEIHEASPRQLYEAMITGPSQMPVFNDASITPDEKQDLIAYVKELQAEPDAGGVFALNRVGQVAEGFIGWTVGLSLIVACAIWITAKQRAHD
ncbi:ubiquinol-cytochrome c reductase cytochrome c subunit [Haloactinospora alba]|uniref:Cytochrome bc1 complex cytochrome c subunit n=1 Tax=Haloactinospora alba TaxID=405555 RepID=A0A543NJN8_9ACTN|nr:cytochrome c [Haloactinospora alba]TQN32027.1 ubiquinol-cytochrome c reductase cytochrome c subunit [Haloactinospora alba]